MAITPQIDWCANLSNYCNDIFLNAFIKIGYVYKKKFIQSIDKKNSEKGVPNGINIKAFLIYCFKL